MWWNYWIQFTAISHTCVVHYSSQGGKVKSLAKRYLINFFILLLLFSFYPRSVSVLIHTWAGRISFILNSPASTSTIQSIPVNKIHHDIQSTIRTGGEEHGKFSAPQWPPKDKETDGVSTRISCSSWVGFYSSNGIPTAFWDESVRLQRNSNRSRRWCHPWPTLSRYFTVYICKQKYAHRKHGKLWGSRCRWTQEGGINQWML